MNFKKYIMYAIIFVAIGICLIPLIDSRIRRNEQLECKEWQKQAKEFARFGYYLTQWQLEQCEAVGYPIEVAPVVPRKDFNL